MAYGAENPFADPNTDPNIGDPNNPFAATNRPKFEQVPNPTPEQQGDLAQKWRDYLSEPSLRAGLMQFGLQLSQPTALGQNRMGHIGQAVGAGGEAVGRVQAQDLALREQERKEGESESKAELRGAQAGAAEARAGAAGARSETAAQKLVNEREKLDAAREKTQGGELLRLQQLYDSHTAKILPGDPIPTFDEWLNRNPTLKGLLGRTQTDRPSTGGGEPVPADAKDRVVGKVYSTPRGPLRYNGPNQWSTP